MSWRTLVGLGAKWGIACGQQGDPWSPSETTDTRVRFGIDDRDGSAPLGGFTARTSQKET